MYELAGKHPSTSLILILAVAIPNYNSLSLKGCYPCQNAVNNIRNLRKSIKLNNLSKSRLKCL
jgi:hypothetical protein